MLAEPRAAEPLRRLLRKPALAQHAAHSLLLLGDPAGVDALIRLLRRPAGREGVLMMLGCARATQAREAVHGLLDSADPGTRYWAVAALGELGDRSSSERVAELLAHGEAALAKKESHAAELVSVCITALAHCDREAHVATFRRLSASEEPSIAEAANLALAEGGDQDAIRRLGPEIVRAPHLVADPALVIRIRATHVTFRELTERDVAGLLDLLRERSGIPIDVSPDLDPSVLTARYGANRVLLGPKLRMDDLLGSLSSDLLDRMKPQVRVSWVARDGRVVVLPRDEARTVLMELRKR
jgi:HEAT repeat protein